MPGLVRDLTSNNEGRMTEEDISVDYWTSHTHAPPPTPIRHSFTDIEFACHKIDLFKNIPLSGVTKSPMQPEFRTPLHPQTKPHTPLHFFLLPSLTTAPNNCHALSMHLPVLHGTLHGNNKQRGLCGFTPHGIFKVALCLGCIQEGLRTGLRAGGECVYMKT